MRKNKIWMIVLSATILLASCSMARNMVSGATAQESRQWNPCRLQPPAQISQKWVSKNPWTRSNMIRLRQNPHPASALLLKMPTVDCGCGPGCVNGCHR
jgi:hypothetical protein